MRSVWWLVVAVCLVAGGVHERARAGAGSYALHAPPVHAVKTARRHQAAPGPSPFVAAGALAASPPLVAMAIPPAARAPGAPSLPHAFVRSSRGPPRS